MHFPSQFFAPILYSSFRSPKIANAISKSSGVVIFIFRVRNPDPSGRLCPYGAVAARDFLRTGHPDASGKGAGRSALGRRRDCRVALNFIQNLAARHVLAVFFLRSAPPVCPPDQGRSPWKTISRIRRPGPAQPVFVPGRRLKRYEQA